MNRKIIPIIESLLAVVFLAIILGLLGRLTENKSSYGKYNEFYEYSGQYDVLFSGSSHMMNMVLPMELWKEYGIRSYNIGNGAETMPITYHVIKNALDHCDPKLIVLDVFYTYSDSKVPENARDLPHQFFDMVPLSAHKTEAVFDLFSDDTYRWNYLYDFSIYHSRWSELTREDVLPSDDCFGGASMALASYVPNEKAFDPPKLHSMSNVSKQYLKKIKDLCDSRGIRLICVVNPYAMWQENRTGNIDFEGELNELGLEFTDLRDAGIVDIFADSADTMHLNMNGQRKMTRYYGQYLTDIAAKDLPGIIDTSSSEASSSEGTWEKRYAAYVDKKASVLAEVPVCDALLSDLNDPDFTFEITVREGVALPKGIGLMLDNASGNDNVSITYEDQPEHDIRVIIRRADGAGPDGPEDVVCDKSFDL